MKFHEQLNEYIQRIDCTAKELSDASGLSPATLSRYRSGERVPGIDTKAFRQLTVAIVQIADKKQEFWVVTTSFDDRGHVVSNITDTIWAILKPQNTSYSTGRKDIYVDYFASREDAEQFVLEARSC
mgnify:CR=1 FL=1